jgi:nucleotide-binding universal stress UspA family protein
MGVYPHIVVGVDGSDASAQAAETAGRLAADLDAKVTAVYVSQLPTTVPPFGAGIYLDSYWQAAERLAAERAAGALEGPGASWRFEVRSGDPATQLDLAAEEHGADLVVVGARGHSVTHRLLLGSVSSRLLHHAPPGAGRPLSCRGRHRRQRTTRTGRSAR